MFCTCLILLCSLNVNRYIAKKYTYKILKLYDSSPYLRFVVCSGSGWLYCDRLVDLCSEGVPYYITRWLLVCSSYLVHVSYLLEAWRRKWQPTQGVLAWKIMDGGVWWASVHGVAKSRTRLRDFTFTLGNPE